MAARGTAVVSAETSTVLAQKETLRTFYSMCSLLDVDTTAELYLFPLVKQACEAFNWLIKSQYPRAAAGTQADALAGRAGEPGSAAVAAAPAPAAPSAPQLLLQQYQVQLADLSDVQQAEINWYRRLIAGARAHPPKTEASPWLTLPLHPHVSAARPAAGTRASASDAAGRAGASSGSGSTFGYASSSAPASEFMYNAVSGHIARSDEVKSRRVQSIATIIDGDVDALTFTSWWYEGSTKRSLRLTHSIHNETFTVTFEDAATGGLATSGLSNAGSAPGDDSADKRVRPAPLAVGQVMSKHGKVTCWDLFVGARVEVFGRPITLMTCNAETANWIEAHATRFLSMKTALEKYLAKFEVASATAKGCVYHGVTSPNGNLAKDPSQTVRSSRQLIHCHLRSLVAEVMRLRTRLAQYRPEIAAKFHP